MKLDKAHLNYHAYTFINAREGYRYPSDGEYWNHCPRCHLTPKIKITDSLQRTACGCWRAAGDRWEVAAESKDSYRYRNKSEKGFDENSLRKNWNYYCKTGKLKFKLKDSNFKWKFRTLFGKKKRWG